MPRIKLLFVCITVLWGLKSYAQPSDFGNWLIYFGDIKLKNKSKNLMLFNTNSAFYIYDLVNDTLKEFSINQSDLTELPFPLYISNQNYQFKWMDILLITLIVLSIVLGMLFFTYCNFED
mgnify:CR=1 FL=1